MGQSGESIAPGGRTEMPDICGVEGATLASTPGADESQGVVVGGGFGDDVDLIERGYTYDEYR